MVPPRQVYSAYSLVVASETPLPCPPARIGSTPDIKIVRANHLDTSGIAVREGVWFQRDRIPDGSDHLRWGDLFECRVSPDGRLLEYKELSGATDAAFSAYVLTSALSFSLLKLDVEHLHATCVVVDERVVGFLGQPGAGKSTLAAQFVVAGARLLTDDLLVLMSDGRHLQAQPGLPRIKLVPESARAVFGDNLHGMPMNPLTSKLVCPLDAEQFCDEQRPLACLYVLDPGAGPFAIDRLPPQEAFLALTEHTYNAAVAEPERLRRHFNFTASVSRRTLTKRLSVPRGFDKLAQVREGVLKDLTGMQA